MNEHFLVPLASFPGYQTPSGCSFDLQDILMDLTSDIFSRANVFFAEKELIFR